MLKRLLLAVSLTTLAGLMPQTANAACSFQNGVPLKSLSAGFEAWKVVTNAMAECGNFRAELDQDFAQKQPTALAARPALYQIGGVATESIVPLLQDGLIRPLDDLVAKYGQNLNPNQLIKIDGKVMAVAMMVNTQHLMVREDILSELGIPVPKTYDEVLAAAEKIRAAGRMEHPLGGTYKTGWNLGLEFVNMQMGFGGKLLGPDNRPAFNDETGVESLEMLKKLSAYMDPEFLVSDSTVVQQQFQQGRIAMANLWASRGGALDDAAESTVAGKIQGAAAPAATAGGKPATTTWWDGIVIARNIGDEEADAAFRLAMEGLKPEVIAAHQSAAIWLAKGYEPGRLAAGSFATAQAGAPAYPASPAFGLAHEALGNHVADFLTGSKTAQQALADAEADYLSRAREQGLVQN